MQASQNPEVSSAGDVLPTPSCPDTRERTAGLTGFPWPPHHTTCATAPPHISEGEARRTAALLAEVSQLRAENAALEASNISKRAELEAEVSSTRSESEARIRSTRAALEADVSAARAERDTSVSAARAELEVVRAQAAQAIADKAAFQAFSQVRHALFFAYIDVGHALPLLAML